VDWEILWRVATAVGLATAVGAEREAAGQAAGLRTHMSVALGACLFGVVSTLGFEEFFMRRELTNVQVDVTRVASNVVVGIGFLGAGLIFRESGRVHNLTTAASVWVTSAIGLASGVGQWQAALITTIALVATLLLLRPVRALIVRTAVHDRRQLLVLLLPGTDPSEVIDALQNAPGVTIGPPTLAKEHGALLVNVTVTGRPGVDLGPIVSELSMRPDVESLSLVPD